MNTLAQEDLQHHAVIIQTNEPAGVLLRLETLLGVTFSHTAHPDIVFCAFESLGINEVRELAFISLQKPVERQLLYIIVQASGITPEAQHALLKQTEEPGETTRYIFVLPSRIPLLTTLRSRCAVVSLSESSREVGDAAHTVSHDLRAILKITKDKDDAAMEVRLGLAEVFVHSDVKNSGSLSKALLLARSYIEARGSSPKMLLEHLALTQHEAKLQ